MADLWQDDKFYKISKTMKKELKIKYLPIKQLKINPVNPRQITEEKYKSLVKSLEDCPSLFDARPCLCSDRTGELIVLGGNMRLRAAKELGYEQVPVIVLSNLSEDQEKEITIKDNGSWGSWDMDLLSGWDDFPLIDWGVDLPNDWMITIDSDNLKEEGSGAEKETQTECPKCGFKWQE